MPEVRHLFWQEEEEAKICGDEWSWEHGRIDRCVAITGAVAVSNIIIFWLFQNIVQIVIFYESSEGCWM
jgi:hypothetical protein